MVDLDSVRFLLQLFRLGKSLDFVMLQEMSNLSSDQFVVRFHSISQSVQNEVHSEERGDIGLEACRFG